MIDLNKTIFVRSLALIMACLCMLGCSAVPAKTAELAAEDVQIAEITTPVPTATVVPPVSATPDVTATSQPTDTPAPNALETAEKLAALDLAVFTEYVTKDGYTLQRCLIDPSQYGIDETDEMQTWGLYSEIAAANRSAWAQEQLDELYAIDRDALTERDCLAYDTLEHYLLDLTADNELFFYEDLLIPKSGLQTEIPLMLSLYRLNTEEDISSYLLLLSDTDRFFSEILLQQQKRAEMGLFMTKPALDAVLSDCDEILNAGSNLYLKDSFSDRIKEIEGLSKSERNAWIEKHNMVIKDSFLPAYQKLKDGLATLSYACRTEEGMYVLGEKAMEQYANRLAEEATSDLTPEDAITLLEASLADLFITMQAIFADDPSVSEYGSLTKKIDSEKLLDQLRQITESMLPLVSSEAEVHITEVSKSLADDLAASVCLVPPIDSDHSIEILLNPEAEDDTLLLTLAHEIWPGHAYQYLRQRSLGGLGLMQQALPLVGYYEGWGQMAEEWLLLEQTKYDQNAAMFAFSSSMISDAILPSIISIFVNYYGYEREDVRAYLAQYGLNEETYVDLYYQYAVDRPYNALRYGISYAQFSDIMRNMSAVLGVNYLQKDVLVRFLDYGPSYFHLIRERMDEWADAKMPE